MAYVNQGSSLKTTDFASKILYLTKMSKKQNEAFVKHVETFVKNAFKPVILYAITSTNAEGKKETVTIPSSLPKALRKDDQNNFLRPAVPTRTRTRNTMMNYYIKNGRIFRVVTGRNDNTKVPDKATTHGNDQTMLKPNFCHTSSFPPKSSHSNKPPVSEKSNANCTSTAQENKTEMMCPKDVNNEQTKYFANEFEKIMQSIVPEESLQSSKLVEYNQMETVDTFLQIFDDANFPDTTVPALSNEGATMFENASSQSSLTSAKPAFETCDGPHYDFGTSERLTRSESYTKADKSIACTIFSSQVETTEDASHSRSTEQKSSITVASGKSLYENCGDFASEIGVIDGQLVPPEESTGCPIQLVSEENIPEACDFPFTAEKTQNLIPNCNTPACSHTAKNLKNRKSEMHSKIQSSSSTGGFFKNDTKTNDVIASNQTIKKPRYSNKSDNFHGEMDAAISEVQPCHLFIPSDEDDLVTVSFTTEDIYQFALALQGDKEF